MARKEIPLSGINRIDTGLADRLYFAAEGLPRLAVNPFFGCADNFGGAEKRLKAGGGLVLICDS